MFCHVSCSVGFPIKLLKIAFRGIDTEPKLMFMKKHMNRTTISIANETLYVFEFDNYSKGFRKKGS